MRNQLTFMFASKRIFVFTHLIALAVTIQSTLKGMLKASGALMIVAGLLMGSAGFSYAADKAQPTLPMVELVINGQPLLVEVASSSQQRYMGLSFRPSMPESAGMLFVYPAERALTFTMRNTLIPLSIAFLSEDMVVNEIHEMNVGPNQLFSSERRAKFALEVNQGWFEKHGITPGMLVEVK